MRFYTHHSPFSVNQIKKMTGSFCVCRMEFYKYFPRLGPKARERIVATAAEHLAELKHGPQYEIDWLKIHLKSLRKLNRKAKNEQVRSKRQKDRKGLEPS